MEAAVLLVLVKISSNQNCNSYNTSMFPSTWPFVSPTSLKLKEATKGARMKADGPRLDGAATSAGSLQEPPEHEGRIGRVAATAQVYAARQTEHSQHRPV